MEAVVAWGTWDDNLHQHGVQRRKNRKDGCLEGRHHAFINYALLYNLVINTVAKMCNVMFPVSHLEFALFSSNISAKWPAHHLGLEIQRKVTNFDCIMAPRKITPYLIYLVFITTLGPLQFGYHLVLDFKITLCMLDSR